MGSYKILAGDFKKDIGTFKDNTFYFGSLFNPELIGAQRVKTLEVVDEEKVKRLAGTAGWAFLGSLALGPLGLIGGFILGGQGKDVTFICEFTDGRKFLGRTNSKLFREMLAATFK